MLRKEACVPVENYLNHENFVHNYSKCSLKIGVDFPSDFLFFLLTMSTTGNVNNLRIYWSDTCLYLRVSTKGLKIIGPSAWSFGIIPSRNQNPFIQLSMVNVKHLSVCVVFLHISCIFNSVLRQTSYFHIIQLIADVLFRKVFHDLKHAYIM